MMNEIEGKARIDIKKYFLNLKKITFYGYLLNDVYLKKKSLNRLVSIKA